jgi:oligopeptide/dipeptide ABC transporter ATP-binding protein
MQADANPQSPEAAEAGHLPPSPRVPDAHADSELLLKIENLKTYFFPRSGTLRAVDGVSFTVRKGEAVGLVGESGSGKSLTCLSIMRLMPTPGVKIVEGKVWFKGVDLLTLSESEMRSYRGHRMAMIMQDPQTSLNPVLTVGEQLSEPVRLHLKKRGGDVLRKVLETLRAVRIPQPDVRVKQYPHQFSGGMRQRVVAAMGLTTQPELLIADEPTTALDVTIQAQFLVLIKDLQKANGTSVIWITHDLGLVAQTCDRVNVMYAGRIVESAPVRKIFKAPQHPYTKALLDSVPVMGAHKERLYQIDGQPPGVDNRPSGCPFWTRCPHAMGICKEQYPPRTSLGGDDFVHCWLQQKS